MTTTALRHDSDLQHDGPTVLVRGFRNRPYRVVALAVDNNAILVAGSPKSRGIGYKMADVFEWDESLFLELSRQDSEEGRGNLWSQATSFDPAGIPSLH